MSKSNCLVSWKYLVFPIKSLSIEALAGSFSSVRSLNTISSCNTDIHQDPSGAPRVVINSKGRRHRPGTKTLAQVLRCNDDDFVDFISRCLVWDPERRMKPQTALRHPFIASSKTKGKAKLQHVEPPVTSKAVSLSGSRSKAITETPKKSQIGAPTPLSARPARASHAIGIPSTSSASSTTLATSRSYRSSQVGVGSLSFHGSSRTISGFAVSALMS
jgi:dual specificity tyrosine-phosphorylation-regulated kinase 2/3/4